MEDELGVFFHKNYFSTESYEKEIVNKCASRVIENDHLSEVNEPELLQ